MWDPSRQLLKSIRSYQKWQNKWGIIGKLISYWNVLEHRFWSIVTASDIPISSQIGGGLILRHPNGVLMYHQEQLRLVFLPELFFLKRHRLWTMKIAWKFHS